MEEPGDAEVEDAVAFAAGLVAERAKELGFTLREIRELLALKVDPDRHCAEVCAKAEEKIAGVDQKIEELTRIRDVLTGLLSDCAKRRSGVVECAVLEGIEREPPSG